MKSQGVAYYWPQPNSTCTWTYVLKTQESNGLGSSNWWINLLLRPFQKEKADLHVLWFLIGFPPWFLESHEAYKLRWLWRWMSIFFATSESLTIWRKLWCLLFSSSSWTSLVPADFPCVLLLTGGLMCLTWVGNVPLTVCPRSYQSSGCNNQSGIL